MSFKSQFKTLLQSLRGDRGQRLRQWAPHTMTGVVVIGGLLATVPLLIGMTMAGFALDRPGMLVLLGLALIVLTVLLVLGTSIAVTRPLKELSRGLAELGQSRYDRPIQIAGPAEMRRLGESLDRLRCKLAQLEADKDLFLRHVSHELKTPLATIKEGAALLREGSLGLLTPRQSEVAHILAESAAEMGARISNLLSYAEWRKGRREVHMDWFEALPLVEETLASQKLPMVRRTLSTELDIQTPRLFGQRTQLRVALDNLVANAVQHSPKGATINIYTGIHDRRCQIWVRDRGRGVEPGDRDKIFEPFVRGAQQDYSMPGSLSGTGIGLSVVRETVLAHGGTVEVEDARPGARFKMEWPCASAGEFASGPGLPGK